jgi:hypothetical protein
VLHTAARGVEAKRVLVHTAAGGVGSAAVQLALIAGLEVIGVTGSEKKTRAILGLSAQRLKLYPSPRRFPSERGGGKIRRSIRRSLYPLGAERGHRRRGLLMQDLQLRDHRRGRQGIIQKAAGDEAAVLGIDEPFVQGGADRHGEAAAHFRKAGPRFYERGPAPRWPP